MPPVETLRQEDCKLEASLSYIVGSCFKNLSRVMVFRYMSLLTALRRQRLIDLRSTQ